MICTDRFSGSRPSRRAGWIAWLWLLLPGGLAHGQGAASLDQELATIRNLNCKPEVWEHYEQAYQLADDQETRHRIVVSAMNCARREPKNDVQLAFWGSRLPAHPSPPPPPPPPPVATPTTVVASAPHRPKPPARPPAAGSRTGENTPGLAEGTQPQPRPTALGTPPPPPRVAGPDQQEPTTASAPATAKTSTDPSPRPDATSVRPTLVSLPGSEPSPPEAPATAASSGTTSGGSPSATSPLPEVPAATLPSGNQDAAGAAMVDRQVMPPPPPLPPPPPPVRSSLPALFGGGSAVLALAAGLLYWQAAAWHTQAEDDYVAYAALITTAPAQAETIYANVEQASRRSEQLELASFLTLGAAGLAGTAALVGWLMAPDPAAPDLTVQLSPGPYGGALLLSGRF